METTDKSTLAKQLQTSAPAISAITPEEMAQYPCTVEERMIALSSTLSVKVFLTIPEKLSPRAPLIVNYHGGGFIRGRGDRDELFCRRLASVFGCPVVDVDYDLAPGSVFPTQVEQARGIALWAKAHGAELGGDPERLILCGQSAGGNLVANVCMAEVDEPLVRPISAVIAYAPLDLLTSPFDKPFCVRDMPSERAANYNALYCAPDQLSDPRVSPLYAPAERLAAFPPTLVISAGDDRLAPEGEAFAQNLARAGRLVTCKRFLHCVHGFFVNRMDAWEEGLDLVHSFIRICLENC